MNHYTSDNIYILNADYLQSCCQTEAHYTFIIPFLQYRGLVQEYFHYLDNEELPWQTSIDESSEDYLQDSYDYFGNGHAISECRHSYTPDNTYEESHSKYTSLTLFLI
jgi:hypothetical protein